MKKLDLDVYTSAQLAEIGALAPPSPTRAPVTLGSKPTRVLCRHRRADHPLELDRVTGGGVQSRRR